MAGLKSNVGNTRSEIKHEIEKAKEKWDEHVKRIKKKKEDETLDMQQNDFDLEDEHDAKRTKKTLKKLSKGVAKKNDFRCLTNNVGKGEKNGLKKVEVVVGEETISVRNKEEMESMTTKHDKEHFSKAKDTKAHKDKKHNSMNENKTRDSMMNGDLNREDCDEEEVCEFLRLLKRPKRLMPDEDDCTQINEWKQVVKMQKKVVHHPCFQGEIMRCENVHQNAK